MCSSGDQASAEVHSADSNNSGNIADWLSLGLSRIIVVVLMIVN